MKTEKRVMDVTSTLEGEKVGMSIDESALAHIMSVLTDLYSDPEMAVLREYSTNAFDAHVEAGAARPIEVTLPTSLSPYLKIRDYGAGLSVDDIRNIYSRYGTSTKRETNDLVGTLGLGCKSALTYTNQFTLQGVKDGKCTQVSVSRDEDGAGSMTIVASYDTDDPTGVEIIIPVKSGNGFYEKANHLFQFWTPGTVLVNGVAPTPLSGIEIDADTFVVDKEILDESIVVMGNVPYPMGVDSYSRNYSIVAFVPIGAVQFTPSREALQMTSSTKSVVEDVVERVKNGTQAAAERMIEAAPNKVEALKVALKAVRLFSYRGDLSYRGELMPTEFDIDTTNQENPFILARRFAYRYHRSQDKEKRLPISIVNQKVVFLTGFTNKTLSPTQRQKLEQWWAKELQQHGQEVEQFVLLDQMQHTEWIDPAIVYKWEDVAAEKLAAKIARVDGRPTGSYEAIVAGVRQTIQADEVDQTQPIFYHPERGHTNSWNKATGIVREAHPTATIVFLSANRVEKFKRLFPTTKTVAEAAREVAQAWVASLKTDDLLYLSERDQLSRYATLDEANVDDPDLHALIKVGRSKKRYEKVLEKHRQYDGLYAFPKVITDHAEKYPMLDAALSSVYYASTTQKEKVLSHLYLYVNAAFAAEKETN